MFNTVPPVLVVKHLVPARSPLKLHDVDAPYARAFASHVAGVDEFNRHAFRKEIELSHQTSDGRLGERFRRASEHSSRSEKHIKTENTGITVLVVLLSDLYATRVKVL
jgi:hypothetical protein